MRIAFDPAPPDDQRLEAIRSGGIALGCDSPPAGARDMPFALPIRVVGWAYSRAGIEGVVIFVDGRPIAASYGHGRPDVASALSERDAARCGFMATLGPGDCPPGRRELTVVATDRNQAAVGTTMTVIAEPPGDGDAAAEEPPSSEDADGLSNDGERYVPEVHRGTYTEAEHEVRYSWAAPLAAQRAVLDAACGVGWGTVRLAGAGARSVVGIDIDERSLASARERARTAAVSAEFVRGDLLALPFEPDSFDLIVCFEAIEHVADPGRALDELRRVLRPDGLLAISSPNRGVYPAGNPHHVRELTSTELEAELRERFRGVAMYRQNTHLGSLLSDDRTYAAADAATAIRARVHKLYGGRPGDELYTVALAGDGELPAIDGLAALGAPLDTEAIALLEDRAVLAEAQRVAILGELRQAEERERTALDRAEQAERTRAETERALEEARQAAVSAEHWLAELQQSASWRVTAPLRATKRAVGRNREQDEPERGSQGEPGRRSDR